MEDPKNTIKVEYANDQIVKGLDNFIEAISILVGAELDNLKKNVEGIVNVIELENKQH